MNIKFKRKVINEILETHLDIVKKLSNTTNRVINAITYRKIPAISIQFQVLAKYSDASVRMN